MAKGDSSPREQFSSKLGVIAAAAGSAVGLGNIWKFPYEAGENGGGAFIVLYIFFTLSIGLPIMISEFVIGRKARANPVGAFKKLAPGTPWFVTGILGVVTSFMILSFYGVVAGWTLEYIFLGLTNGLKNQSPAELKDTFDTFVSNPIKPIIFQAIFMVLTAWVVLAGVKNGIERITKILMPVLFIIIIILCIRSVTLGLNVDKTTGAIIGSSFDGLQFLFKPDFTKVNIDVILNALGQAFFSLSLGMGTIITYGSYVRKNNILTNTALEVTILDTLIALLAGVAIFPAVFYFGVTPSEGPSLVFTVLPSIFQQMMGGYFWTLAFFILLAVAALTSSISLLEVAVSYFSEELKLDRKFATILTTVLITMLGVACSLSLSEWSSFTIAGNNIFDMIEKVSSNVLLPLGGLFIALFIGWYYRRNDFIDELSNCGTLKIKFFRLFFFIIKFIAPIAITVIFLYSVGLLKF